MGFSTCRICGRDNGAGEYLDDVVLWPEGLAHYVMDHSVRLPEEIIEHIKRRVAHDMSLDVDRTWWQSIRPG
jgi:hypothetical protein